MTELSTRTPVDNPLRDRRSVADTIRSELARFRHQQGPAFQKETQEINRQNPHLKDLIEEQDTALKQARNTHGQDSSQAGEKISELFGTLIGHGVVRSLVGEQYDALVLPYTEWYAGGRRRRLFNKRVKDRDLFKDTALFESIFGEDSQVVQEALGGIGNEATRLSCARFLSMFYLEPTAEDSPLWDPQKVLETMERVHETMPQIDPKTRGCCTI